MEQKIIITAEKVTIGDKEYLLKQVEKIEPENAVKPVNGKWYWVEKFDNSFPGDALICYQENTGHYGFGFTGVWMDGFYISSDDVLVKASFDEIAEKLQSEALKRGYGEETKARCLSGGEIEKIVSNEFMFDGSSLLASDYGFGVTVLMTDGKWAEIIEDKYEVPGSFIREVYENSPIVRREKLEKQFPGIKF
jgi:hypothetical protein